MCVSLWMCARILACVRLYTYVYMYVIRMDHAPSFAQPTALTRLETVFAAHRFCACELELSDLYALRENYPCGPIAIAFL